METISRATKRPWYKQRLGKQLYIAPVNGGFIADLQLSACIDDEDRKRCEADADLIVRAANAYDDLLATCKTLAQCAHNVNARQHAGLTVLPEDWPDLYHATNTALGAIAAAEVAA